MCWVLLPRTLSSTGCCQQCFPFLGFRFSPVPREESGGCIMWPRIVFEDVACSSWYQYWRGTSPSGGLKLFFFAMSLVYLLPSFSESIELSDKGKFLSCNLLKVSSYSFLLPRIFCQQSSFSLTLHPLKLNFTAYFLVLPKEESKVLPLQADRRSWQLADKKREESRRRKGSSSLSSHQPLGAQSNLGRKGVHWFSTNDSKTFEKPLAKQWELI